MTEDRPPGESQREGSTPDNGAPRVRRPEPQAQRQPQPQPESGPGSPPGNLDDDRDQEASLAATMAETEAAYASGLITPDELDEDDGYLPPDDDDWGGDNWGSGRPSGDGPIEEPAVAADDTGRGRLDVDPAPGGLPRREGPATPGAQQPGPAGTGRTAAGPAGTGRTAAGPAETGRTAAGPAETGRTAAGPAETGRTAAGRTGERGGAGVPGRGVPAPRPGDRRLPARAAQSARSNHSARSDHSARISARPEQASRPDHAPHPDHAATAGTVSRPAGRGFRGRRRP